MSFINSKTGAFIYAKLTDTGRKLLSQGNLTYDYWVFGDSEIDYGFYSDSYDLGSDVILAPKDKNANIKYPIASKDGGDIFNTLPTIVSNAQVITNVAPTRGFFTGSTTILSDKFKGSGTTTTAFLAGGSSTTIEVSSGSITNGDILLIQSNSPSQTYGAGIPANLVTPYLFYMVEGVSGSGSTKTVTVDRTLPYFNSGSTTCDLYFLPSGDTINTFYGSGSTTPYWNNNTLSFESNCNVSNDNVQVWNFSVIYTENIAGVNTTTYEGMDAFETKKFAGFKEYVNYTSNSTQKSIGVIHYTNNSISNYYAEGIKTGTFSVNFPTLLWHKGFSGGTGNGNSIGMTFSARTTNLSLFTDPSSYNTSSIPFSIKYDDLVDTSGNIVGKVFFEIKVAVIEDEELLAALSYKSNRNWSLPTLSGTFINAPSESLGLLGSNEELYITYLLANESGYGYSTPLHCQSIKKISRGGTSQNNVKVNLPYNQLPYMKTDYTSVGGFTADKLYLIAQKVTVGQNPVSSSWKLIDVTSSISGHVSGNIDPLDIENSSFTIDLATYTSGTTYDLNSTLNIPLISEPNKLQFGDETFLFGNINAEIQATAYKSSFLFNAPSPLFNTSVNPTFNSSLNDSVYISEVGIYNSLKQLVAIGKLANPIKKKNNDTLLVQLEIDF